MSELAQTQSALNAMRFALENVNSVSVAVMRHALERGIEELENTRKPDAKAMIAEGLYQFMEEGRDSFNPDFLHIIGDASDFEDWDVETVLDTLYEVCKQPEGSE